MKINKIVLTTILLLSNWHFAISQHKIKFRLFATPKVCNSNLSGISLGYHSFIGGNASYDIKTSFAYTTDFMGVIQYDLNKSTSINIGFGTSNVKQKFKLVYESFGVYYKPVYNKIRFQKVPIALEKRFDINSSSQYIINVGYDLIFDLLKPKTNQKEGNLKLIEAVTKEEITYASYQYTSYYITSKTFNPILSIGLGYKKKLNSKLSFLSIVDFKQGFSPQVNSFVYVNQYYSDPNKVAKTHIFSSNNGQSINLNLGLEYNF